MNTKQIYQIFRKGSQDFTERKTHIMEFLRAHPVGILSTVTPEQKPRGAVIYIAIGRDNTIAFVTKKLTRKYRDLQWNPHVSFVSFEPISQTTVTVLGKATEVTDSYEINQIADAMLHSNIAVSGANIPPISKLRAGAFTAFIIKPSQLYMASYTRPGRGGYEETFELVESNEL